ncbi:aquaporin-like protein [Sarocladium strictum]
MKGHGTAVIGETLGTAIFLFIAEGAAKTANLARTAAQTQTDAPLDATSIQLIGTAFGLSLLVCAWMFYRVTGGLFNPAITVALWLTGVLTTFRAVLLFAAQLLGGIIASALLFALTPGASSGDAAAAVDVVNTTVSNQISYQQALILEMLGTSSLVFSVLMLAVEKHRATYLAPVGIGLNLFVIHLFLVAWTGCSLNPARSLGPAAVGGNFPPHHWIYWVGPIVGGILAVIFFHILKALNYNSSVLDQDSDHECLHHTLAEEIALSKIKSR